MASETPVSEQNPTAVILDDNGLSDGAFDVYCDNGENLSVVYTQMNKSITNDISEKLYEDDGYINSDDMKSYLGSFEVKTATFKNNEFAKNTLTDDDSYDTDIHLGMIDGKLTAVWIKNDNNSMFGISNPQENKMSSIWCSTFCDGQWSNAVCVAEDLNTVTDIEIGDDGVAYITDVNNNLSTAIINGVETENCFGDRIITVIDIGETNVINVLSEQNAYADVSFIDDRIAGYLLCVAIFCLFYYICKIKSNSVLITSIFTVFVMGLQMIVFIFDYNYLNSLIVLIIFALYIKYKNKDDIWFNLLIGVLIGLTPIIKQNTGFLLMVANAFCCLIELLILKKRKRIVTIKFMSSFFPLIIFIIIVFINGTAKDFYEFAIEGIGTFSHRFTPVDLAIDTPLSFAILVSFITMMLASVVMMIKRNNFDKDYCFVLLSMASFFVIYPLCDTQHLFCSLITITPFVVSYIKPHKKIEIYICWFASFFVVSMSVIGFLPIGEEYTLCNTNKYSGIISNKHISRVINNVDDYILSSEKEGYKVRIANDSAAAYMIPLNKYEKNWSMLLVGNIGKSSIEDLLQEPKKCKYLVYKNTDALSMQNHFELINYIKNNYKYIEEIECFDVYEKIKDN